MANSSENDRFLQHIRAQRQDGTELENETFSLLWSHIEGHSFDEEDLAHAYMTSFVAAHFVRRYVEERDPALLDCALMEIRHLGVIELPKFLVEFTMEAAVMRHRKVFATSMTAQKVERERIKFLQYFMVELFMSYGTSLREACEAVVVSAAFYGADNDLLKASTLEKGFKKAVPSRTLLKPLEKELAAMRRQVKTTKEKLSTSHLQDIIGERR